MGAQSRPVGGGPLLRPARSIRNALVDGLQVILDLRTESYYVFDDVASAMWGCAISDVDPEASFPSLASRFDIPRERLRQDFSQYVQSCIRRGFLESTESVGSGPWAETAATVPAGEATGVPSPSQAALRHTPMILLIAQALRALLSVHRELQRRGFRATYERCERQRRAPRAQALQRACRAFRLAENLYISRRGPDDCLLRSLALLRFLCAAGLAPDHVIGVRRVPFAAHAWVECDGVALLDDSQARVQMTPLARLRTC